MRRVFQPEWRTQNRLKRRFYAKYMNWLEKGGYFVVFCVFAAFVFAFNYKVDDVIAADGVEIRAAATPIASELPSLVERLLVEDGQTVVKGQALFTLVEGDENVRAGRLWSALESLKDAGVSVPDRMELSPPPHRTVAAPVGGTVRLHAREGVVAPGEPIASIVDFSELTIDAELEGNTVPRAREGLLARVAGISYNSESRILFRGSSRKGDVLSSSILKDEIRQRIESRLKGSAVLLRDDLPLAIEGVGLTQVDAHLDLVPTEDSTGAIQAEPATDFSVKGTVASGTHLATVQVAELPQDLTKAVTGEVGASVVHRKIRTVQGGVFQVERVGDVGLVVQLKAKGALPAASPGLKVTAINRRYAAKITLDAPPRSLVDAVRTAEVEGRKITGRVEVVTGSRPIALILLKKS